MAGTRVEGDELALRIGLHSARCTGGRPVAVDATGNEYAVTVILDARAVAEVGLAVERAVVLAQGEWIDAHDMVLSHLSSPGDTGKPPPSRPAAFVPMTIEEMERQHVMQTLAAVGGNKTKAAAILGIERSTLDRKLAKWASA